jgi:serine/threonine protein kinase
MIRRKGLHAIGSSDIQRARNNCQRAVNKTVRERDAPQADIYAFGILPFELLTGAKPLGGGTVEKIFHEILHAPLNLEPLKTTNVPAAACALIERCTAKDPDARPQTFAPVCEEIERLARGERSRQRSTTARF